MATEELCAFPGCTRRNDIELQVPNPEREAMATISLCWHCTDQMHVALGEKLAEWFKNVGLDILLAELPELPNEPEPIPFDRLVEIMHQVRDAKPTKEQDA